MKNVIKFLTNTHASKTIMGGKNPKKKLFFNNLMSKKLLF